MPHFRTRSAPLVVLAAYLVATSPAALLGAREGARAATLASVHLTGLALVIAAALTWRSASDDSSRVRAAWSVVLLDWLPLAAVPLLYAELPFLIAGAHSVFRDAVVQDWERALFGVSPAHSLAGALPYRPLSELLHLGYLSYYALIFGPPLVLYARGRRSEFALTVAALMTTFSICFVVFVVFPVAGPRYVWPAPPGVPSGPIRSLVLKLLAAGSSRGAAFPSSHVAVAVTQTIIALRFQRRVGAACAVLTTLLAAGAVYGGFHYGVDVAAGTVVGLAIGALARRLDVRAHAQTIVMPGVGTAAAE